MKKFIEKLHFITHDIPQRTHVEQAQLACEAGAKWIQYRCLSKTDSDLLEDINEIATICDDWGSTLIVTDHIHLKGQADIQGFHMENMDADFVALRQQLGDEFTLGSSAHTISGLIRLADEGADYVGFGPFNHSGTKPNQFSLLGLQAYFDAAATLKARQIDLPIIAVGGITLTDAKPLIQTGIHGIAVSGAINQAPDLIEAYHDFYKALLA